MEYAKRVYLMAFLAAGLMSLPASAADRKPIPVPDAPRDKTYTSLRDVQYCEVWLFRGTPDTGIAGVYFNTSDLNNSADKKDTCPSSLWDKVSVKSLESKFNVIAAYKNGPRGWTMDTLTIPVGPVETFDGIEARWMGEGKLPKGVSLKVAHMEPYQPLKSHRKSTFTFDKGKPVFNLVRASRGDWHEKIAAMRKANLARVHF